MTLNNRVICTQAQFMRKIKLEAIILTLGFFVCWLAQAEEDPTLCATNEDIYFSCPLSNGRIVSICAHGNNSPRAGYVQYRYGSLGNIELAYPPRRTPPESIFYYVNATEGSASRDVLKFKNGRYVYVLYQAFFSGLTVLQDGKVIFKETCEAGANAIINRKVGRGITAVPKSEEDFR